MTSGSGPGSDGKSAADVRALERLGVSGTVFSRLTGGISRVASAPPGNVPRDESCREAASCAIPSKDLRDVFERRGGSGVYRAGK